MDMKKSADQIKIFGLLLLVCTVVSITADRAIAANHQDNVRLLAEATAVEPNDFYVEVLAPSVYLNEGCSFDYDTNQTDCWVQPLDDSMLLEAQLTQNVDNVNLHELENSSTLTFNDLPNLPPDVLITGATLVAEGVMLGNEFGFQLESIPAGVSIDGTITHDRYMWGEHDCYNRYQSEGGCSAVAHRDIVAEFSIPAGLVSGWYAGANPQIKLTPLGLDDCDATLNRVTAETHTRGCLFQSTSGPKLQIEYAPIEIGSSEKIGSAPSYGPDLYGRAAHEHQISPPENGARWGAVAASLVNEFGKPLEGTSLPINVRTDFEIDRDPVFDTPVTGHEISYVVIDQNQPNIHQQQYIELQPWADNPVDGEYRVQQVSSTSLPNPTPLGIQQTVALQRGSISLFDFETEPQANIYIRVTTIADFDLHLELFPQNPGKLLHTQSEFAGRGMGFQQELERAVPNGVQHIVQATVDEIGDDPVSWGLAIAHDRPLCITVGDNESCWPPVVIEIFACPFGSYFTEKWGCQSLIYPHATIFPLANSGLNVIPATSRRTVGNVSVFSEGGFDDTPSAADYGDDFASYQYCTQDEGLGMPLLGTTDDTVPILPAHSPSENLVAVRQGSVCVTNDNQVEVIGGTAEFGAITGPSVREIETRPAPLYNETVSLYHGTMLQAFGNLYDGDGQMAQANMNLVPAQNTTSYFNPWAFGGENGRAWPLMEAGSTSTMNLQTGAVDGIDQGIVIVTSDNASNTTSVNVAGSWVIDPDFDNTDFTFTAETDTILPHLNTASLEVRFEAPPILKTSFVNQTPQIEEMQFVEATIHQSEEMGAAFLPIQAVIPPAYTARLSGEHCDETSCLDLRNATNINSADWDMPDIDISDNVGTMMLDMPGDLYILSNDHPDAGELAAALPDGQRDPNFAQSFNFRTFSGAVTVERGACDNVEDTLIITGRTNLALPTLGDGSNSGPGLLSEFKLCENELRQVKLTFNAYPPGIPIGNTGLSLKSLSGEVVISPEDYATITVEVSIATADGAILTDLSGKLVIDTRGQFELAAGAKLVGIFDVDGSLSVAWDPLDILLAMDISYTDWMSGFMRLHMWRGQGWGDPAPYPWLPDNNAMHFTGTIAAKFEIDKGEIGQFFGIKIPRRDILISADVTFGEFCKNDSCSRQAWGVQGRIKVMRFTVGIYVGTGGRELIGTNIEVDFFLGDKGKTLIDEFGTRRSLATAVGAETTAVIPNGPVSDLANGATLDFGESRPPCPQTGSTATCTFQVDGETGELMFSVAWAEGTLPTPSLETPSGIDLVDFVGNVFVPGQVYEFPLGDSMIVSYVIDQQGALFTVENPEAGSWELILGNLSGAEHYNVMFAANSVAPELTLTAPNNLIVTDSLDTTWNVSPLNITDETEVTVQLSYVPEGEFANETVTPTIGLPISGELPADQLSHSWTPVGLASGTYRLIGRLTHPIYGSSYVASPGTFTIQDSTPPDVPTGLTLLSAGGNAAGLIASWERNTEADLSSYEVVYNTPDPENNGGMIQRLIRVNPSDPFLTHPSRETTRLVGLLAGVESSVCIRAVDASGNSSDCSSVVSDTPEVVGFAFMAKPILSDVQLGANGDLSVFVDQNSAYDGYLLSWANSCGGTYAGPPAAEGWPNMDIGGSSLIELTDLPAGTYRFATRGYLQTSGQKINIIQSISSFSDPITVVVTDNVDENGDGLPDDWAERYDLSGGATADDDGDQLTNGEELIQMTNPAMPDSDDDGFFDGEEAKITGTNPCDPADFPDFSTVQFLNVNSDESSLRFEATAGQAALDAYTVHIGTTGRGMMDWTATPSASWINVSHTNGGSLTWYSTYDEVVITADTTGLEPGFYSGEVVFNGTANRPLLNAPQSIPVRLWVLRPGADMKNRVSGYVFLDENGNGAEDPSETIRIGDIEISLLSQFNLAVETATSSSGTGNFSFAQVPLGDYSVLAHHPSYVVTTANPLFASVQTADGFLSGYTFGVMRVNSDGITPQDQDGDGVPDPAEDSNRNGNLDDDDLDGDGTPNYKDSDDDGDGVNTRTELTEGDTDADGRPNYLDEDDDNDGQSTKDEGDVDRNNDGIPDYLDSTQFTAVLTNEWKIYLPMIVTTE